MVPYLFQWGLLEIPRGFGGGGRGVINGYNFPGMADFVVQYKYYFKNLNIFTHISLYKSFNFTINLQGNNFNSNVDLPGQNVAFV